MKTVSVQMPAKLETDVSEQNVSPCYFPEALNEYQNESRTALILLYSKSCLKGLKFLQDPFNHLQWTFDSDAYWISFGIACQCHTNELKLSILFCLINKRV